jgi:hypothetical protein
MRRSWCILMLLLLAPPEEPRSLGRAPTGSGEVLVSTSTLQDKGVGACILPGAHGTIWNCDGARIEYYWCEACLAPLPLCQGWCILWCACRWTPGFYCDTFTWCPYGEHCTPFRE